MARTRTEWLNPQEQRAWRTFIQVQSKLRHRVGRQTHRDTGLSEADYEVLVNLSEAPDGRLRAFELGRATEWEKSRLSHHVTRMAERGLVARESCPTDTRGAVLAITPAGRSAIESAAPQHVEHVRRWFIDALSPAQLDALADICETVLARLDDEPCDDTC
jgi:DNA-binding MarR family transcriptional regulator